MDGIEVEVREVRPVGPDTIALELETPDGFEARPGQFVRLHAEIDGESYDRFYTLSSPDMAGTFEVTVGVDPDGDLSPHLADLGPGEMVEISGPFGNSYYEDEPAVVVLAGGPGVGPAVGIGERALADGGEVAVIYQDDDLAHENRLAELAAGGATVLVVGDGEFDAAVAEALDSTDGQVFIYGFADFLDDAFAALDTAGYEPDEAKAENFG